MHTFAPEPIRAGRLPTPQERSAAYALGDSPTERRRLDDQATILRPVTQRLLRDTGIGPSMHVVDVGCGNGDVTLQAAELVGRTASSPE
jgi:2-polyprenyl-3-methyl-5-hydroxy-6-metoxy-1,4-benzoquinol methylase